MKNYMRHNRKKIALLFIVVPVFVSLGVVAQNTALQKFSKSSLLADVVKPCGTYSKTGVLVQALSDITNDNGCLTTISKNAEVHFTARNKIILQPGFTAYAGSIFLADIKPFALNNEAVQAASVDENLSRKFTVSPNPFTNSFVIFINAENDCKAQVTLNNAVGAKTKEQKDINLSKGVNKILFKASDLVSGLYILEVNYGDTRVVSKIVKGE